jgi:hypothetical protein
MRLNFEGLAGARQYERTDTVGEESAAAVVEEHCTSTLVVHK